MRYTADLETTTDPEDCRVWAWGIYNIDTEIFSYGNDLNSFFMHFAKKSATVYFHNLKFDGEFILYWLFNSRFKHVNTRKELTSGTFTTLITNTGQWYTMTVCIRKTRTQTIQLTINDSLKILPFSVDKIAKTFKLPIKKGTIDYKTYRAPGHKLTDNEIDYLKRDVEIMGLAMKEMFAQNMKSITIGANALSDYKRVLGGRLFEYHFPMPSYDADIRKSYRGGFTYLNPIHANTEIGGGIVLDVNSLYPFVMYDRIMPIGEGVYYDGVYIDNHIYPLYIQMIKCQFELKNEKIPTIQIKNPSSFYDPVEYITSSGYDEITLCLTCVDLKLFLEQYNVYNLEYISGWMFQGASGLFKKYIDKWTKAKITAKVEGNNGLYTIAKLMLNSLYGKFATNPKGKLKIPVYDTEENFIRLIPDNETERNSVYIPVASFITSYARDITIRAAQSVYHRFIYADTDSLHLIGRTLPQSLKLHPTELGAWDHEFTFSKGFFIRPKTYIEIGRKPNTRENEQLKVTCAGLPHNCHDQVTFKNFRQGATFTGKLAPKRVPGGVILIDSSYKIKTN